MKGSCGTGVNPGDLLEVELHRHDSWEVIVKVMLLVDEARRPSVKATSSLEFQQKQAAIDSLTCYAI